MNWTREQQRAIEEQGNLIVSAAAGAGKTAVLTERVVRLVEGGMDVDRLLILTFTRAAAAEMKERIQSTLQQRAAAATDEALKARLYRQGSLRIRPSHLSGGGKRHGTVHSETCGFHERQQLHRL